MPPEQHRNGHGSATQEIPLGVDLAAEEAFNWLLNLFPERSSVDGVTGGIIREIRPDLILERFNSNRGTKIIAVMKFLEGDQARETATMTFDHNGLAIFRAVTRSYISSDILGRDITSETEINRSDFLPDKDAAKRFGRQGITAFQGIIQAVLKQQQRPAVSQPAKLTA